ncbi:MAG: hypothetical protein HKP58_19555 [Desulfatitalea sp.]|nr:hypothetical protein [Desulfatitalea sp.]NNK02613.1 hypothetical protein [Desulfatitalea sp.]
MQPLLSHGVLTKKQPGAKSCKLNYIITTLEEKHLPEVMHLQKCITQNLPSQKLLKPFSHEFMKQHLGHRGIVLGVFVEAQLVAFRCIYFPAVEDKEWNLGIDLKLPEEKLPHVANLQMVCVHPDFRGNALALKMNRIALARLREIKTHYHVCATVSPDNIWNIPVLLASGFCIARLKKKYRDKMRYIVYQNLLKPMSFQLGHTIKVPLDDLDTQIGLLRKGYVGTHMAKRGNISPKVTAASFNLIFQLPLPKRPSPVRWNMLHVWHLPSSSEIRQHLFLR